jgi:long-chain acyl-CoA synthetase
MTVKSIPARLFDQAKEQGQANAYFIKNNNTWTPTNYSSFAKEVREAAKALIGLGVKAGDKVTILGFNRPEWVIFDVAAMTIGAIPAGIYTTCSPTEVQYIIDHSESEVVLLENQEQLDKVIEQRANLPKLRHAVMMKGAEPSSSELVLTWDQFLANGDSISIDDVNERLSAIKMDDLATFIYTSGTTGPPKAVMLTHNNLAWTADLAMDVTGMGSSDCGVSYLPLSHIAEQMFTIHAPITAGSAVYYAESIALLPENLKEVQPTIFFGVPRIWEKISAKLGSKLSQATGVKAKLVAFSLKAGTDYVTTLNQGKKPGIGLSVRIKIARKLVLGKILPLIGFSRTKFAACGAAPIAAEVLQFFAGLGIPVHEVYGQSEDSGPTTFNMPGSTLYGSVGKRLEGINVRIAEDGEIQVSGPNVFSGYYKDEAATNDALQDGWLLSGDLGKFDDNGYLFITGRKKDIIITAGGKNIAPKNIESAIKNHPLVGEAVVIGDKRKFLSALITVDPEAAEEYAQKHTMSVTEVAKSDVFRADIEAYIESKVNSLFARVEHIRKFTVLAEPFSIENGELTPTLKVKRAVVNSMHADTIDAMYQD